MADMEQRFLGITVRRWVEYTAAILIGNAIYYFSLVPPAAGVSASGIFVGLGERDGFCGVLGSLWVVPAGLKIVIWSGLIRLGAKV
jgi:hypothetical protein